MYRGTMIRIIASFSEMMQKWSKIFKVGKDTAKKNFTPRENKSLK
jgi:hypothetical protein